MAALEKMTKVLLVLFSYVCLIVSISLNLVHFALHWLQRNQYNGGVSAAGGHAFMPRNSCPELIIQVQKMLPHAVSTYV